MTVHRPGRRRPSPAALVRVALWLSLLVVAAGVAVLVAAAAGLVEGVGAGLVSAGVLTALVLYFLVDVDEDPRR